jgi:hypothetical protein
VKYAEPGRCREPGQVPRGDESVVDDLKNQSAGMSTEESKPSATKPDTVDFPAPGGPVTMISSPTNKAPFCQAGQVKKDSLCSGTGIVPSQPTRRRIPRDGLFLGRRRCRPSHPSCRFRAPARHPGERRVSAMFIRACGAEARAWPSARNCSPGGSADWDCTGPTRPVIPAMPRHPVYWASSATREGRLRHNSLIRDGWRDSDVFSILDDEWRSVSGL